MKRIFSTISLAVAVMLVSQISAQAQEPLGHYCSHCASYKGEFTIKNNTGVTINYQVRWGNKSQWEKIALASGSTMRHSYPLGYNRNTAVPKPYVKFDRIGGDGGNITNQVYSMEFYSVKTGSSQNTDEPKRYYFRFAANRRDLDLYSM